MVRLREIPRTAAFAWSSDADSPWLATGTKSGAVDIDFSNETCLELWDLALDDKQQGQELKPAATVTTDTGLHDLAWTTAEGREKGIIAGALDSGNLGLWDADAILAKSSSAAISSEKVHTGAIKTLQFNPKIPNFVATGGVKGELFVSDLNQTGSAIRLGSTAARADDIDCLDWNKKVSNILVTGSSGGFVTVWDMRTKKESLTLNNNGRKAVSAIAWDPQKPTRLITAVPLEQEPIILVWDLRNSNAPEKTLRGHDSGVLSLSWCPQDPDLLLSSGMDNRTILWNPQTGTAYGDYPVVTNWTFQTRFNPHNPNFFATASFDGKIQVQSLQNTNPSSQKVSEQSEAADGEDFFSKAPTQPQSSSFSLQKAPKWLERPCSASFGFGGRLITVRPVDASSRTSKIDISKFEVDSSVGNATETFEKAIGSGDLGSLCAERIASAKTDEERADWQVIQTLVSSSPRKELTKYLGFEDTKSAAEDILETPTASTDEKAADVNGIGGGNKGGHKRFTSLWANSPDGDFLSELAATKGTKTNNPFEIFTGTESEADRKITRALILGRFEDALEVCLKEERISDAFMIAICGGEKCIKKAQEAYFAKQSDGPNYLRLLASVVGKNLWDTVHNADLSNWKEVMATLCTFASEKEFPDLCEALGDRFDEQITSNPFARKDASFCYLAGSKLEKVISIWIQELKEHEESTSADSDATSAYSVHARGLQDLIEKVSIFRSVVNFQDLELSKTEGWKLESLYSKYLEYADVVAASGQLNVAQKYLDLLPAKYPGADIARTRIEQATKKKQPTVATTAAIGTLPASTSTPTKTRQNTRPGYAPPQDMFAQSSPAQSTPYAPQSGMSYAPPTQPGNPYAAQAAPAAAPANPYAPPQQARPAPTGPPQYGMPQPGGIAPPPRQFNQSPSIAPPSQAKNMVSWNDVPDDFAKPTSRRGTPLNASAQPPVPSPFGHSAQQGGIPPPMAPPLASRGKSPVAPPPKAGAGPQRVTSPLSQPQQSFDRPPSATNPYAPPASSGTPVGQNISLPPVGRVASPYNAPPSNAPVSNRYAPAPGTQPSQPVGPAPGTRPNIAPPPQGSSFTSPPPSANPYGAQAPPPQSRPGQYGPGAQQTTSALPPTNQQQFSGGPPPSQQFSAGPPPSQQFSSGPPPGGPPQQAGERPGSSAKASAPPAKKYPKGDRSHISPSAQPIVDILSAEMARVEGRAPSQFKPQVDDAKKRLNILFDHLNNEDLLKPDTVQQIVELSQALQSKDYGRAQEIQLDVHQNKVEESGLWMVGVKRLIGMSKGTP